MLFILESKRAFSAANGSAFWSVCAEERGELVVGFLLASGGIALS
jgi:hypothetical protein